MSDVIGFEAGVKGAAHRVCKVAYTLNNDQPVVCTIIGDQPLFYMDFEAEMVDEDALFDAAEMSILEAEIEKLHTQVKSLERMSADFTGAQDEAVERFLDNEDSFCKESTSQATSVEGLKTLLKKSRLAQAYMEMAAQHKVEIVLTGQVAEAVYDRKALKIFVNANLDIADQALVCARELRRHWQHRQGALIHPLMFHPDNAVLVNRVQTADLSASIVRIAWELQLSGYKDAWERIETSSMADLGRAFAREAYLDFRTINSGQACAAVFEAWFLSERCRIEDRRLIQGMLADYQGYVFDQNEAEKSITPALIAALGAMPFGKNYLSAHVSTLMSDPIFTDVRDRSNANFLWFIKFEKSFRQTEQELQSGVSNQGADGLRQAAFLKETQKNSKTGTHNAKNMGSDARVVELHAYRGARPSKSHNNGKSAEIIYLR